MEEIRATHAQFQGAWSAARSKALTGNSRRKTAHTWGDIWQANGIAYASAKALSDRVNQLLGILFEHYLGPSYEAFLAGEPAAVDNVIAFLSTDVLAFRCGYRKENYLRLLKSVPFSREHGERLRDYVLSLCSLASHRREIAEAGRLMIRIADQASVDRLRSLAADEDNRVATKSKRMLDVVLNGRKDLR